MKKLVVFLLLLVLFSAPVCFAHGGSLDSNGGHWDHSTGTYHYHSGIHTEGSSSGSSGSSSGGGTYYRTTANVNMRMSASGSSQILQTIPANSKVTYMGSRSGNWIQVFYNLKTGWCHADYLVKLPKAVATAKPVSSSSSFGSGSYFQIETSVNMRLEPSQTSQMITTIPKGATVEYIGSYDDWVKVYYNYNAGYVLAKYLEAMPGSSSIYDDAEIAHKAVTTAAPSKKSVKSSRKELLPMTFGTIFWIFAAGFGVGLIILAVYAHKAHEHEFQITSEAVRRENLALERGKQDVINKHNADIEMRRNLQMQMIKTLNVLKSLETPSVPDVSKGVVYASSDLLAGGLYHHAPNCSRGTHMVLISKVVADQLSLTPCPSCSKYPMPESDPTVYITQNNLFASLSKTVVYHKANCYCIQGRSVPIKLSNTDSEHYSPCSHCCPPTPRTKPVIWF